MTKYAVSIFLLWKMVQEFLYRDNLVALTNHFHLSMIIVWRYVVTLSFSNMLSTFIIEFKFGADSVIYFHAFVLFIWFILLFIYSLILKTILLLFSGGFAILLTFFLQICSKLKMKTKTIMVMQKLTLEVT